MNHSAISVSEIKALKEEANKQFKAGQYSQAESQYYDILMKIDDSDTREDIVNENKIIYSNLAVVLRKQNKKTQAMKMDIHIIKKIDKTFTKSYARLIKDYLDNDNFTLGRYYYSLMKTFCKKEEFVNFSDLIQRIENEISMKDAFANSFSSLKQAFKQK